MRKVIGKRRYKNVYSSDSFLRRVKSIVVGKGGFQYQEGRSRHPYDWVELATAHWNRGLIALRDCYEQQRWSVGHGELRYSGEVAVGMSSFSVTLLTIKS